MSVLEQGDPVAVRTTPNVMRVLAATLGGVMLVLLVSGGSDAQATSVVINELQPRNAGTIVDGQGDTEDWIELYNPTGDAIDMSNWRIDDSGAQWPIPAGTVIQANGYLLIWASDKGDPTDPDYPGPFGELHANFQLNGTTDTVTLRTASLAVVDSVTYDLPFEQDESYGRNSSGDFVLFLPGEATPLAPNGPASTPTPTPEPAPPSIVINEAMQSNSIFLADGGGDYEDWFELFNPTCSTVDLGGWAVRDSSETWTLPAGTTMAPGDVLFLWASNKGDPDSADFPGPAGELHTNFQLAAAGETVYLLDDLGRLVASETLPPANPDESYARTAADTFAVYTGASITPDELNPGQAIPVCVPTPTPTPGGPTVTPTPTPTVPPTPVPGTTPTVLPTPTPTAAPGVCASVVRINELQSGNDSTIADGDGDFSDWIELYNPAAVAVDLAGWRITDTGNTFTIPADTTIPAGGFLLIWASDKGAPGEPGHPGPVGEVHANFRLSGDGEIVSLFDPGRCLVDRLSAPALDDGQSFGVLADGSTGVFNAGFATPLAPNGRQRVPYRSTCYAPDSPIRIERLVSRNDGLLLDGDGDASDFIELRNTGASPVDLTAWQVRDESDRSVLPAGTMLDGGQTLVLWASGKGFVLDDGYPGPAGEVHLTFRLAGEGEQLTLLEPSECIVEQFVYPELQDNQAYGFAGGADRVISSPGSTSAVCAAPGSVLISALSPRNDAGRADREGDFGDWLELRNTTADPIDISGWVLSDEGADWIVPDGVVLHPGDDRVVWADEKPSGSGDGELHASFRLAGEGETITLISGVDCPVDQVLYPEVDDDQVYRRSIDGSAQVTGAAAPDDDAADEDQDEEDGDEGGSSGVTVVSTACISISELMAKNDSTLENPDGEYEDWLELANAGDEVVDLSGHTIGDDGSAWTIPDGTVIEARGFLLVWADEVDSDDPGDLRTDFKLASEGEPITLLDPDGEVVASLSGYPELDDDEAFGVDDTGAYVFIEVGDATPDAGPMPSECEFELTVGSADASGTEAGDDDSGDGDQDERDESDDPSEAGQADAQIAASADEDLARTGTDTDTQALLAQTLLISGATIVAIAQILRRRSGARGLQF